MGLAGSRMLIERRQSSKRAIIALFPLILAWSLGCSRNFDSDPPEGSPVSGTPQASQTDSGVADAAGEGGDVFSKPGLTFDIPSEWSAVQPSGQFRAAEYRLPRIESDSEDAELVVFYFGQGQGGSVEANLQRWKGQFTPPPGKSLEEVSQTSASESNGVSLTVLRISGTYNKSVGPPMMGRTEPHPGYRMLAVVAETSAGPYFLKLTGPEATIVRWESLFEQMLRSIRPS